MSNSNRTQKPMQDLNGWDVEEMTEVQLQMRMGVGGCEEDGEERMIGNYTGETHHGAHTPLMQTAVLQENTEI